MSINCDVILQWIATPEHLKALGAALWGWCNRNAGDTGIYQFLDNQPLADLIAGKLPASSPGDRKGVRLKIRDEISLDRQTTIDSLRRELPATEVVDILVDGISWSRVKEGDSMLIHPRAGDQADRHTLNLERAEREDRWRDDGGQG